MYHICTRINVNILNIYITNQNQIQHSHKGFDKKTNYKSMKNINSKSYIHNLQITSILYRMYTYTHNPLTVSQNCICTNTKICIIKFLNVLFVFILQ